MYDLISLSRNEPSTEFGQFLITRGISFVTVIKIEEYVKFPKVYFMTCRDENGHYLGRETFDKFSVQYGAFRAWYCNPVNRNRLNEEEQIIVDCILRYPSSAYVS